MIAYQKIPGSGKRMHGPIAASLSKLWLASDHVLCQEKYGLFFTYYEKYRRFYFRDIQGITVQETHTSRNLTILWATLLLLCLGFVTFNYSFFITSSSAIFLVSVVTFPSAFLLGLNLWRGPSCRVKIHTAVQVETLPSLNRFKRAQAFLLLVNPLITQAQGPLVPPENFPSRSPTDSPSSSRSFDASHPPGIPEHMTRKRGVYLVALSFGLIFHALATAFLFFFPGLLLGIASALLGVGVSIFWVVATIQSSKYRITRSLRNFSWVTLAYICTVYMISFVYYGIANLKNPSLSYDVMEWLRLMAERPVSESLFLRLYDLLIIAGSGILGFIGLFLQRPGKAAAPLP